MAFVVVAALGMWIGYGLYFNHRLETAFRAATVGGPLARVIDDVGSAPARAVAPEIWLRTPTQPGVTEFHYQAWAGPTIYAYAVDPDGRVVEKYVLVSP